MKSKRRWLSVGFVVAILAMVLCVGVTQNRGSTDEKQFTIQVISERDSINEESVVKTDKEFLGEWMREEGNWVYSESEYGIYVEGYKSYMQDIDNQYWWSLSVNDESSMYGADEVVLEEGSVYTWELKQGW